MDNLYDYDLEYEFTSTVTVYIMWAHPSAPTLIK